MHAEAIAQSDDRNSQNITGWSDSENKLNQITANTPSPQIPEVPKSPETTTATPPKPTAPDIERLQKLGQHLAEEQPVAPTVETQLSDSKIIPQSSTTVEPLKSLAIDSKPILQPSDLDNQSQVSPKSTNSEDQSYLLNTITALGIVIAIIFLLKKIISKMSGTVSTKTNNSLVELLSRTSVAPRNHVLVLRVGQRVLIVSDSSQGLRTLSEITNPEEIAHILANVSAGKPNSVSRSFNQLFKRYDGDYDQSQWTEEGADQSEHAVDRARDSVSSLLSRVKSMSSRGGSS